ncbi:MAG: AAA family ATPase, partial [Sphaerochaetaceae bacterium]|nr:AAA family ATPase [Sphaerochaetaceae bacterium]
MLESLDIRNLALIEDIHIDFMPGFNVLTGETGAGKSIILGALSILLGEKADSSLVRLGAQEASVTAVITIDPDNPIIAWLEERGIALDDRSEE